MTYAQEIAMNALKRALGRKDQVEPLTKANLATAIAECASVEAHVFDPQPAPARRRSRPKANLRAMAFAEVLADGAALLEAKSCQHEPQ